MLAQASANAVASIRFTLTVPDFDGRVVQLHWQDVGADPERSELRSCGKVEVDVLGSRP